MLLSRLHLSFLCPRLGLILLPLALLFCARSIEQFPADGGAERGGPPLVDLSHVRFSEQVYLLDSRWDFYWQELLSPAAFASAEIRETGTGIAPTTPVPDARFVGMTPWTDPSLEHRTFPGQGYGTYRMLVRLPPGQEYAFRFQQQLTAYRVYADGILKIEAGRIGKDRASSEPERKQHTLYGTAGSEPVELIVQVSNYHMFRGGLRGILVVGQRAAVDAYANRKIVLDLILFGFFIAIFLYHLSFFFMQRRDWYFLAFALFVLGFALRIPFMSEKTIWLIHIGIPWDWHLRVLGTINIVSPAFLMILLRTLYPDGVSRRAVLPYVLLGLVFLLVHFFDLIYLAPAMFIAYGLLLPVLLHTGWVTLRLGFRGNMGALLMAIGVSIAAVLGFISMYLNWRAEDAAPMALLAFSGSILFQALGIGRNYRDSLAAREKLNDRLVRSQAALREQRKELEINLHDSLGGALTDVRIIVERGLERLPRTTDETVRAMLANVRKRLESISRMFRGQLLFMEDLELATRDPITGLHMTLLRRYSDAGRELVFEVTDRARPPFVQSMSDDNWRLDILQLARELCTNDLKYGRGESRWKIALHAGRPEELHLIQSNRSDAAPGKNDSADIRDIAPGRATERTRKLGGRLNASIEADLFSADAVLPLYKPSP